MLNFVRRNLLGCGLQSLMTLQLQRRSCISWQVCERDLTSGQRASIIILELTLTGGDRTTALTRHIRLRGIIIFRARCQVKTAAAERR